MPRNLRPLEVVTIRLYDGDREILNRFYGRTIGYNLALREIVSRHVRNLLEREARSAPKGSAHVQLTAADLADLERADAEPVGDGTGSDHERDDASS